MTAEQEQLERLERLLRVCTWLLRISSVIALGLVSWGSYSVIRWLEMPIPVAIAYPVVIDMAMLYVTPFAVNAMLPDTDEWPIRRKAGRIRAFVWVTVAAFNVLHAWMMVAHLPLAGPMRWVAYGVATVIGVGPVVFYGYAYGIEAMVSAWVVARRSEILIRAEVKEEAREERREAREARREARPAASPVVPREAAPSAPRPAAGGKRTPQQEAMLEEALPGGKVGEQTAAWIVQRHQAGRPCTGTEAAKFLGTDPATTRRIYNQLDGEGKLSPRLALAGKP